MFLNLRTKLHILNEFHKIRIIFWSPTMGPKTSTFWGMEIGQSEDKYQFSILNF